MIWHYFFFYKEFFLMGNSHSFAEAFKFPLVIQNSSSAALGLRLLAHRGASPLITGTGSSSERPGGWGPGESRAGVLQRVGRQVPGCWHLASSILCLHTVSADAGSLSGPHVKGKAVTLPRLNSDRINSTRIPDQAALSCGNCIFL